MLFGESFVVGVPLCSWLWLSAPHDADMRKAHMRTPCLRHCGSGAYSVAKGKKKRPSDDGLFSLCKGYEKDNFRGLLLGFELKLGL